MEKSVWKLSKYIQGYIIIIWNTILDKIIIR